MYADPQRLRVGLRKGIVVPGHELFHKSIDFEQSGGIHFTRADQATRDQPWRSDRGGC
jgi:hypothetical protein